MQEQLISFETSKLAYNKKYSNGCYTTFTDLPTAPVENYLNTEEDSDYNNLENDEVRDICKKHNLVFNYQYERPTQGLLQRWLREKKLIDISVDGYYGKRGIKLYTSKICMSTFTEVRTLSFNSYEEALEEALQEALKLIK